MLNMVVVHILLVNSRTTPGPGYASIQTPQPNTTTKLNLQLFSFLVGVFFSFAAAHGFQLTEQPHNAIAQPISSAGVQASKQASE